MSGTDNKATLFLILLRGGVTIASLFLLVKILLQLNPEKETKNTDVGLFSLRDYASNKRENNASIPKTSVTF